MEIKTRKYLGIGPVKIPLEDESVLTGVLTWHGLTKGLKVNSATGEVAVTNEGWANRAWGAGIDRSAVVHLEPGDFMFVGLGIVGVHVRRRNPSPDIF